MALRAVYREVRRAAKRLDASPLTTQANSPDSFDANCFRSVLNIKAFLLPEPYSPEAMAYATSCQLADGSPWSTLVHFGARRAMRARLDPDDLLGDGLSLLKELGELEHSLTSSAAFRKHAQPVETVAANGASDSSLLHLSSHAALAAILDGAQAEQVEARIGEALEQLSSRALSLARSNDGTSGRRQGVSPMVRAVNHALFVELGLHSLSPAGGMSPLDTSVPPGLGDVLEHTRAALIHRAFEAPHCGSPLALGLILGEVLGRCMPSLPPPKIIALPLATQPLATWRAAEGLTPPKEDDPYRSVLEAALRSRPSAPNLAAEDGEAATQNPRISGGHHRILVACVDAPPGSSASASVTLLDASASGARTQLECSDDLIAEIRQSDPRWDEWAAQNGYGPSPEDGRSVEHSPTPSAPPWEVPASALLDRPGVIKLLLRQLADLYHAAGTPHALRMHHRCAQLLADMDEQQRSGKENLNLGERSHESE